MRIALITIAALGAATLQPALAAQPLAKGQYLAEADLSPVRDVLTTAQQRLRQLGYKTETSGHFDAQTHNSVLLFQSDHNLTPTGNIDLATLAALGINAEPVAKPTPVAAVPPPPPENPVELGALILKDPDKMSSPQYMGQGTQVENIAGVPESRATYENYVRPPGIDPGLVLDRTRLRWDSETWD